MPFAIELRFDPETEGRILEIPISEQLFEATIHSIILVEYPPTRLIEEKSTRST